MKKKVIRCLFPVFVLLVSAPAMQSSAQEPAPIPTPNASMTGSDRGKGAVAAHDEGRKLLPMLRSYTAPLPEDRVTVTPLNFISLTASPQSGRQPEPAPRQSSGSESGILTLDQVIDQVEAFHPKLLGADAERRLASARRLEKQGAFDPVVMFGTDFLQYNSTSRRGSLLRSRANDVVLEFMTRSGIKVQAGSRLNFGTLKSPLSSTGDSGEYFVGLKIPFLRGFRVNEKSAAERQAFLGEPLAAEQLRLTLLELQLKASESYWDWIASKRKLEVARRILELARIRAQGITESVKAGDMPGIDAVEAEQEVQRRQGSVIKAERDLQKAAFKLSLFLWRPNGLPAPVPAADNAPHTFRDPALFTDLQAVEGQRLALERRPELKIIRVNRDIAQVDLDLGRNQRRPALDFGFSPGRDTGVGGIGNTLKADLTLSLPLRQRTADGKIQAAQLKMQKLDFELQNQRQSILIEVNDAINAINTTFERYRAAENELQAARRVEQGERDRFTAGMSTLFLVNQRERATAEAENKVIEIRAEYEQAVAAFRAATGSFRP